MTFTSFDRIVNPNDEACYILKTTKDKIEHARLIDIISILKSKNDVSLGMYVPKGLIIIEVTDSYIIEAIKDRQEKLMVAKKKDKYYIFAKSSFDKVTVNNILTCGVSANTLVYTKKGTEVLLPFHSRGNILPKYADVRIIYDNGIGALPYWLQPLRRGTNQIKDGLKLPISENAERLLMNHVIHLASVNRDQQIELLKLMNKYFVVPSLGEAELKQLIDSLAENFMAEFMNKNEFYHDKLGDYVIKACHIKKDRTSHKIYFYDDKENIYTDDQNFLRGFITKLCPRLKTYQKNETIDYITDYLETECVDFNSNPYNIVFKNGILNVLTLEFEPMSPDHYENIKINANYLPNIYSETAETFFHNVTKNDKDTETLLYEAIGYAMIKTVDLHKAFMMTGSGRNGKSTFIELLNAILNEKNCAALSFKDMANNFRVSTLVGKLASCAADISAQPITESDLLKSVSAGDRILLERKYEQAYEDRVFATLFFACNKLPRTPDTTDGFYRRRAIIPFDADLSKIKNVEGHIFKTKLLAQESVDFIAYRAVQEIHKVLTTTLDFTQPQRVTAMLSKYKVSNSSVLSWFKEEFAKNKFTQTEEEREVSLRMLENTSRVKAYESYQRWCENSNKQALSKPNFEDEVYTQFKVSWLPRDEIE